MKNILLHGLGQNNNSWNKTIEYLKEDKIETISPNLYEITRTDSKDYKKMYNAFSQFCNNQKEKLNLCGLSLGGILILDYVKDHPENVNSIILIGTPYKIPKTLFKLQSVIFHIMPRSTFEKMGCLKKEFITLVNSMSNLDISSDLDKIKCSSLVICGAKDNVNMENAKLLNKDIKNSKLKIIENAGHEVNIDNPKDLANIVYEFWKDNQ
ncbi:MAG: alpha/beta hydrolase [Clostridium sp.]|nr:alpha/beta hydrolase [Clostridium sp.]